MDPLTQLINTYMYYAIATTTYKHSFQLGESILVVMYSRCNGCLAASIMCNYDITIVLSRNSAGGCHCITFSDSGRVPGTTEEDPRVQAQSGTKNMFLELNQ